MGPGHLESLGLGVAKWTIGAGTPGTIECAWYGGTGQAARGDRPQYVVLQPEKFPAAIPGKFRVSSDELPDMDLDIVQNGPNALAITARSAGGEILARGLGLADPDAEGQAIMISWWTGEVEPYGVVKYTIDDEVTVRGYYISRMTPDDPGVDIATGDASGGFPGEYVLNSREVNGRTWGPHAWTLTARGDLIDLTWAEQGKVFCRGVGMFDPVDAHSIIATYIAL